MGFEGNSSIGLGAYVGGLPGAHVVEESLEGRAHCGESLQRIVSGIISQRRRRSSMFPDGLFADPAWEILLALTLAEGQQRRLTVSKLCDRVDVPATTALRWINVLTEEGILVRREDTTDKRRKYVELSHTARLKMVEYCSSLASDHLLAA